jgi:hypothetical protein
MAANPLMEANPLVEPAFDLEEPAFDLEEPNPLHPPSPSQPPPPSPPQPPPPPPDTLLAPAGGAEPAAHKFCSDHNGAGPMGAAELFRAMDADGSGTISREEFRRWWKGGYDEGVDDDTLRLFELYYEAQHGPHRMDTSSFGEMDCDEFEAIMETVRAVPGRLSALSVFLLKSILYGAFVWAHRALNGPKRRFPARADRGEPPRDGELRDGAAVDGDSVARRARGVAGR